MLAPLQADCSLASSLQPDINPLDAAAATLLTPCPGLPCGPAVTIDIETSTPLLEVKRQLQLATGIPIEHQKVCGALACSFLQLCQLFGSASYLRTQTPWTADCWTRCVRAQQVAQLGSCRLLRRHSANGSAHVPS